MLLIILCCILNFFEETFLVNGNNSLKQLRSGRQGRKQEREPRAGYLHQNLLHLGNLIVASSKRPISVCRARRKWRKVVTGDPNKRIRDHMREVPQVQSQSLLYISGKVFPLVKSY